MGRTRAAEAMIETVAPAGGVTLGADKAYDAAEHVANLRKIGVTPHVAQNRNGRRSAIDRRTTRHAGYAISQCIRKRIEEPFGWIKQSAGFRKTRHRGIDKVGWMFTLNVAAYNLILLPRLLAAPA
jgi:IS5 family transposase